MSAALRSGVSVGSWHDEASRQLAAAAIGTARLDARLLLEAATGLAHARIVAEPDRELSCQQVASLAGLLARRLAREPVSRILGRRAFMDELLEVTPATLDPRPETETLVEAALEIVRQEGRETAPLRLLDLGTGTGAILIALLQRLPNALGVGTDIEAAALEVAARNAQSAGVGRRASFFRADWLDGVPCEFDIIVSNPPYIRSGDIDGLEPEVAMFDPRRALDGGGDGLDAFRRIAGDYRRALAEGGSILLEVGAGQADAVLGLLASTLPAATPCHRQVRRDLSGYVRCVALRPHAAPAAGKKMLEISFGQASVEIKDDIPSASRRAR